MLLLPCELIEGNATKLRAIVADLAWSWGLGDDFLKWIHVVSLDDGALARVAPYVAALAEAEGLPAHAESVRLRGRK